MTDIAYRRLGSSGLVVSTIGIGCNNFGRRIDDERATDVVHTALDLGINLFDTADIYGDQAHNSEEVLGAALGKRRDDAVIATKFGGDVHGSNGRDLGARGARRYIRTAVETSLKRLGTDRIDLYQLHFPDAGTPIEETMAALDDLVRTGKVLYIGHSNFAGHQIADAAWIARTANLTPFVSAQNRYSLINREVENDVLPACEKFGLGLLPYFPLESGLLTGKYRRGEQAPAGTRLAGDGFNRWLADAVGHHRAARALRRRPRRVDARSGHRRPARAARRGQRHRGGHHRGTGPRERRGRRVASGRSKDHLTPAARGRVTSAGWTPPVPSWVCRSRPAVRP